MLAYLFWLLGSCCLRPISKEHLILELFSRVDKLDTRDKFDSVALRRNVLEVCEGISRKCGWNVCILAQLPQYDFIAFLLSKHLSKRLLQAGRDNTISIRGLLSSQAFNLGNDCSATDSH